MNQITQDDFNDALNNFLLKERQITIIGSELFINELEK